MTSPLQLAVSSMKCLPIILGWLIAACGLPLGSYAASIPGLHSSGVNNANAVQAIGAAEQHFAMTGLRTNATVIQPAPPWIQAPPGSAWIGPLSGLENAPSGCCYIYKMEFDLAGLDPKTASISGRLASDDYAQVLINGMDIGFHNEDVTFTTLRPFKIASGFVPGVNILEIRVSNCNEPECTFNPSGLLVTDLVGTADPAGEANLYVVGLQGNVYGYAVSRDSAALVQVIQDPDVHTAFGATFSRWGELFLSVSNQHPHIVEERPGFVRRYAVPYGVSQITGDLGTGTLVTPHGLAFRGDELLATDPGNNQVRRYSFGPRGEPLELPPISSTRFINEAIRWVIANPNGSDVFVSQCNCGGVNNILRFRAETNGLFTELGPLPGSFNNPHGMAFSPWGEMFTANTDRLIEAPEENSGFITRHTFDADGSPRSNGTFTHPSLSGPVTLAFSPWGELFINNQSVSNITRFTFTADHTPVYNGTIQLPGDGVGIAFRPANDCASRPDLTLTPGIVGTNMVLTLPTMAENYALDWTTSLASPVLWRPSYASRSSTGAAMQIIIPLTGGTNGWEFFRLRCPGL